MRFLPGQCSKGGGVIPSPFFNQFFFVAVSATANRRDSLRRHNKTDDMDDINLLTFLAGIWLFAWGSLCVTYGLYIAGRYLFDQWRRP